MCSRNRASQPSSQGKWAAVAVAAARVASRPPVRAAVTVTVTVHHTRYHTRCSTGKYNPVRLTCACGCVCVCAQGSTTGPWLACWVVAFLCALPACLTSLWRQCKQGRQRRLGGRRGPPWTHGTASHGTASHRTAPHYGHGRALSPIAAPNARSMCDVKRDAPSARASRIDT